MRAVVPQSPEACFALQNGRGLLLLAVVVRIEAGIILILVEHDQLLELKHNPCRSASSGLIALSTRTTRRRTYGGKPVLVNVSSGMTESEFEQSIELRRDLLAAADMDEWK